jgi:sulfur-carrier protein adenylyltransferase/sulfurtransferase
MVPSCAEGGVLGVLPGVVGCIQATEAIKLMLGVGQTLVGRLLRYDAMGMTFKTLKLRRDKTCPVCGDSPTISHLIDYEQFCGIRGEESTTIIRDKNDIPTMTVRDLKKLIDERAFSDGNGKRFVLLDVREPHEHQICNLPQAKLIPLGTLPARLHELPSDVEYVVHCKMGGRSAQAVDLLQKGGLRATNVAGGITAWAKEIDPSMPTY